MGIDQLLCLEEPEFVKSAYRSIVVIGYDIEKRENNKWQQTDKDTYPDEQRTFFR